MLNTIVAESLDYMATKLEAEIKAGKELAKAVQELLPPIMKESKKVIFNGNGYAEEWHAEAEKPRIKPNPTRTPSMCCRSSPARTRSICSPSTKSIPASELQCRFPSSFPKHYVKTPKPTQRCMMAMTMILLAALKYQKEVGESIAAAKAAGANNPAGMEVFGAVVSTINELILGIQKLEKAQTPHGDGDAYCQPSTRKHVFLALNTLRVAADKLETMVADDLWPLLTYPGDVVHSS